MSKNLDIGSFFGAPEKRTDGNGKLVTYGRDRGRGKNRRRRRVGSCFARYRPCHSDGRPLLLSQLMADTLSTSASFYSKGACTFRSNPERGEVTLPQANYAHPNDLGRRKGTERRLL
jgi:hypothetical protein